MDAKVPPQNLVSGQVMLSEPLIGIPNVLVVVYDVDPANKPEELIGRFEAGSVVSRSELGVISDAEYLVRTPQEKRPDLLVLVMGPESRGRSVSDMPTSPSRRSSAWRSTASRTSRTMTTPSRPACARSRNVAPTHWRTR